MKKLFVILIVFCLSFSLFACGSAAKPSGVLMEDFEANIIKEIDEYGTFSVKETDDGYTFEYEKEEGFISSALAISGTADAEKNITYIKAETKGLLDIEYFNSLDLEEYVTDLMNWGETLVVEGNCILFINNCTDIMSLCSGEDVAFTAFVESLLAARESPQVINDWVFSITSDANEESLLFTATYEIQ